MFKSVYLRSNGYINENKTLYSISSQIKAAILATEHISETKKNPDSSFQEKISANCPQTS